MRLAAILLLGAAICHGQDARSLVARAVAADDHSDRLARDYTYKVRDDVREFDSAGRVTSTRTTLDEVLYIGGKQYFRALEKEGKPIPPDQTAKEQARLDHAASQVSRLPEAERKKRLADAERERRSRRDQFDDVPDAFDFKLLGDDPVDGRPAYEIKATPRPGYRGKGRNIFSSIEGTLWIDKADFNWVKFEADVLKPFSIGWFLARVSADTHISYEMMHLGSGEDGLWVPKTVFLKASARLALLKKVRVEQRITFTEYRKFQTDSRVVSTEEAP